MMDINTMSPHSGRQLKENNQSINVADIVEAVYDAVNGVLKTSANQSTHDSLNANANLQINNADNAKGNPAFMVNIGEYQRSTQVSTDQTLDWPASSVVNTTKTVTFSKSDNNPKTHEIIVANQSLVTALNVDIGNIETTFGITDATQSMKSVLTTVSIPASTSAIIEDCEDAWNEQVIGEVTATADAGNKQVGSNSAKFAVGANFATGIIGSEVITSTNLSKYTHIYFWFYSDVALNAGDYQFLLDNTVNCASPVETLNLPAIPASTWTRCRLQLANPDSDLAIVSIGLKQVVDKGAINVYIDDVTAVKLSIVSTLVQGWRNGMDGYVRCDNATALSSVQGFSAKIRAKELF